MVYEAYRSLLVNHFSTIHPSIMSLKRTAAATDLATESCTESCTKLNKRAKYEDDAPEDVQELPDDGLFNVCIENLSDADICDYIGHHYDVEDTKLLVRELTRDEISHLLDNLFDFSTAITCTSVDDKQKTFTLSRKTRQHCGCRERFETESSIWEGETPCEAVCRDCGGPLCDPYDSRGVSFGCDTCC